MVRKGFYTIIFLGLGLMVSSFALNSAGGRSLKELEAEIRVLKEENLKLRQQIEELNSKLDILLTRIEKLEQANQAQVKPADSFEEVGVSGKKIQTNTNLPVIKVEPDPRQPQAKVIEIIDEDKKKNSGAVKSAGNQDVVSEAKRLIGDKKYQEAEALLQARLGQKPSGVEACNLLYWLGTAQLGLGKNGEAIKSYQELSDKYPACELAPEAMFKTGEIYEKMGNKEQARRIYQELVSLYPFSKYANLAEEKLKK